MDPICKDCIHSIFCPTWGDYKCVFHARRFIEGLMVVECQDFKERGKDFEEKPCRCAQCLERSSEEDDV